MARSESQPGRNCFEKPTAHVRKCLAPTESVGLGGNEHEVVDR